MKKLLLSMLATFLVIGLVGAGTFAWFQDTETSTGNTFTAGTMDLRLHDGTTWVDGLIVARWTGTNLAPGDSIGSNTIQLREFGTIPADHLEITAEYTSTLANDDDMARYLEITNLRYEDTDWYINLLTGERWNIIGNVLLEGPRADWEVEDQDNRGWVSLYDLKVDPADNLPPPVGTYMFTMALRFNENAGNDLQGQTFNLSVVFTLNQDSSQ